MKISSEQEMLDFSATIAQNPPHILELIGDVGAGKTTFTRGFAKSLGVKQAVTSPSFTISKSYSIPDGKTLIHYDFYRLPDPGLMLNDLKEKIENENNIIVIEWGNSIKNILPDKRVIIEITKNDDETREIKIKDNQKNNSQGKSKSTTTVFQNVDNPRPTNTNHDNKKDALQLFLDTSTPDTILKINDKIFKWHSGHNLAEKLLEFIHDKLQENGKDFKDITSITFMSGPGSFTGLRIGASIVNTLAHELNIPLYTHNGKKVKIILPEYGRDANISKPLK